MISISVSTATSLLCLMSNFLSLCLPSYHFHKRSFQMSSSYTVSFLAAQGCGNTRSKSFTFRTRIGIGKAIPNQSIYILESFLFPFSYNKRKTIQRSPNQFIFYQNVTKIICVPQTHYLQKHFVTKFKSPRYCFTSCGLI
jgi:hypothetical protein